METASPRARRRVWTCAETRADVWEIAAWAVVALGAAVRIVQWIRSGSLWVDEASLALNIIGHSYVGLFGDLDFLQAAPVGFLLAEKLVGGVLGYDEHALRLVPLAAGLASLLVFSRLSRQFAVGPGRIAALLVVALSPPLVRYSSELKQYSVDVLATVVILLVALSYRDRLLDARSLIVLSIVGGSVVWFSQASVFVLAGAFGALALDAGIRADTRRLFRLLVPGAVWVTAFGASYLTTRPNVARIEAAGGTLTVGFDGVSWYPRTVEHLGVWLFGVDSRALSLGYGVVVVAGVLAGLGLFRLARDDWFKAVLLVLPVAAAMGAATLDLYPLFGRFALFALPSMALLIGSGVTYLWPNTAVSNGRSLMTGLAMAAIAVFLLAHAPSLAAPERREDLLPVLEHVRDNWRPGDVLYVHEGSEDATAYNARVHGVNVRDGRTLWQANQGPAIDGVVSQSLVSHRPEIVVGALSEDGLREFSNDLEALAGKPRVWFIFSHVVRYEDTRFVDELPAHVELLEHAGSRLSEFHGSGAVAYLYRLSKLAPSSDRGRVTRSTTDSAFRGNS